MSRLKEMMSELGDDALCTFGVVFALFVLANLLYAGKSMMGIDLFPGHAGNYFAAGSGIYHSFNG